jgi:hypothetical protein
MQRRHCALVAAFVVGSGLSAYAQTTTRVSVATGGTQGTSGGGRGGGANVPNVRGNGRFVTFNPAMPDLVAGDTNGTSDAFVHDRQTVTTERVNLGPGDVQSNSSGGGGSTSADGRSVAFVSVATNLVAGDTNGLPDAFVRDRQTSTTTRVSVATGGGQATGGSGVSNVVISGDGRFVAFDSSSTNLVAGDTNLASDVFVHDRQTGTTTRKSVSTGGAQANVGGGGGSPVGNILSISFDGRFIAFASSSTNLVAGDRNISQDVFCRDRQSDTTTRVSIGTGGVQGNSTSVVSKN